MVQESVRLVPGRMSLVEFCRRTAGYGRRRRVPGVKVWAQALLPDQDSRRPRVEGGLQVGRLPPVWVRVEDRRVDIRHGAGRRPIRIPAAALGALTAAVLAAYGRAQALVLRFWLTLRQARRHSDRKIRGAAVQVWQALRHGRGALTPGLIRQVWSAAPPFGIACWRVAERTGVNAGRVRYILSQYAGWWRGRRAGAPEWQVGLHQLLGLDAQLLRKVVATNKWHFHKRRRKGPNREWMPPLTRSASARPGLAA